MDDGWFVGRVREVPGVFSQGATLTELEENIQDAYELMLGDAMSGSQQPNAKTKDIDSARWSHQTHVETMAKDLRIAIGQHVG